MPAHNFHQSDNFYNNLTVATVEHLINNGFTLIVAQSASHDINKMIRTSFGGELLYIKKITTKDDIKGAGFDFFFIDCVTKTFARYGIEKKLINSAAINLHKAVKDTFSGEQIYIPKEKVRSAKEINKKVVRDFNGVNTKELAKKYNYSTQHIYRIIREDRKSRENSEEAS